MAAPKIRSLLRFSHDSLEDQGDKITYNDIEERFGPEVAHIVRACSDAEVTSTNSKKPDWKERKIAYIESIRKKPPQTLLVTTADKLHNSRSILRDYYTIGEDLWPRFNGGGEGTLLVCISELVKAFEQSSGQKPYPRSEFSRVVVELNEMAERERAA